MNSTRIHYVQISPIRSFGATAGNTMFMQRRGSTNQFEYGNAQHGFYVIRLETNWTVERKNQPKKTFLGPNAQKEVETFLFDLTGTNLTFSPRALAYCYTGSLGVPENEKDDVFLSPLVFNEYSDTVRHVPSNYCVVAFKDGNFDSPILDVDRAAEPYLFAVKASLGNGFHPCDRKIGDAYCKRRLAWLAGSYLIDATKESSIKCAVLARDMTTFVRI